MMKNPAILLISGIFFFFIQCSDAIGGKNLELSISFDKDEYKKSDSIQITFRLKNKSKDPIYVNKRFYLGSEESPKEDKEVWLSVISPSGEKLPLKTSYKTGLPKSDYFIILEPGEEVALERPRNIKYSFDFNELGTYKITAFYENVYGKEIGLDSFQDKIKSKTISIRIVE